MNQLHFCLVCGLDITKEEEKKICKKKIHAFHLLCISDAINFECVGCSSSQTSLFETKKNCYFCDNTNEGTEQHFKDYHRIVTCKYCQIQIMKHSVLNHNKHKCYKRETICPARICKKRVTYKIRHQAFVDPSILITNHDCRGLITCRDCGKVFILLGDFVLHVKNGC